MKVNGFTVVRALDCPYYKITGTCGPECVDDCTSYEAHPDVRIACVLPHAHNGPHAYQVEYIWQSPSVKIFVDAVYADRILARLKQLGIIELTYRDIQGIDF